MRAFSKGEPSPTLEEGEETVRRQIDVEADPADVWEAIATEEGRSEWLEADPDRELLVEIEEAPERIVWWWWHADRAAAPRRVELRVVAIPAGARVIVTESLPELPLAGLARCLARMRTPLLATV
jgi:uncharacterized protein YndB with AHSA1/START domain